MALTLSRFGVTYPDGNTDINDVAGTLASAQVGQLGTYAMLKNTVGTAISPGGTAAGSILYYSNAYGANWYCYTGVNPPGTWRVMGYAHSSGNPDMVSIWLRIA